ncbi:DUF3489 domain-containing protein [Accumulibacter sp.]|uniref:DUF3489 domain-containing protein n=1 Tax=Accumulibacter sp. TaxID=2053492 RepID=UPI0025D5B2C0|nr:DUF3489 domain-containing protein [Accumulibacter sp.]MCM8625609.1 DUF3489 domain-containing protein [Accumulibacter sp.]
MPARLPPAAQKKVVQSLVVRGLVVSTPGGDRSHCRLTPKAYAAVGRECELPVTVSGEPELDAIVTMDQVPSAPAPEAHAVAAAQGPEQLVGDKPDRVLPPDPLEPDQPPPAVLRPLRTRENSKQATVIAMLQRPEGATIAQICALTGWLAHTARGCLAGALKKKLGLTITSEKPRGGERVYRLA